MKRHLIRLYDDWLPVKEVFKKPTLKVHFGKWRNDPCLPVWRRGPIIRLYKIKDCSLVNPIVAPKGIKYKVYPATNCVSIKVKTEESNLPNGSTYRYDVYDTSYHNLPKGVYKYDYVWERNIRRKLKKCHLGWIKPNIQLPIWMAFHIFNHPLYWKTKYDEYRYEFAPQFSLVFFGLSLSFWLEAPKSSIIDFNNNYWEAILYYGDNNSLKEAIDKSGIWDTNIKGKKESYFAVRPEYITDKYLLEYNKITTSICKEYKNTII